MFLGRQYSVLPFVNELTCHRSKSMLVAKMKEVLKGAAMNKSMEEQKSELESEVDEKVQYF